MPELCVYGVGQCWHSALEPKRISDEKRKPSRSCHRDLAITPERRGEIGGWDYCCGGGPSADSLQGLLKCMDASRRLWTQAVEERRGRKSGYLPGLIQSPGLSSPFSDAPFRAIRRY